jgi:hypothetical protein
LLCQLPLLLGLFVKTFCTVAVFFAKYFIIFSALVPDQAKQQFFHNTPPFILAKKRIIIENK